MRGAQVLSLDAATHQLSLLQRLSVPSVAYPCRAQWDAQGRLWVVGGAPVDVTSSLHVAVLDLTQTGEQNKGGGRRAFRAVRCGALATPSMGAGGAGRSLRGVI